MMQVMSLVIFLCTKQSSTKGNLFKVIIETLQDINLLPLLSYCRCVLGGPPHTHPLTDFFRMKRYSFSKVYLEFYGHKLDKFCALCSKKFRKFSVSNCKLHEKIVYVYWSSDFDNNLTWQTVCKILNGLQGGYFGLKWELKGTPKFWVHQMTELFLKDKMFCF